VKGGGVWFDVVDAFNDVDFTCCGPGRCGTCRPKCGPGTAAHRHMAEVKDRNRSGPLLVADQANGRSS